MEEKERIIEKERKELLEKYLEDLKTNNFDDAERCVLLESLLRDELWLEINEDQLKIVKRFWRWDFRLWFKYRWR